MNAQLHMLLGFLDNIDLISIDRRILNKAYVSLKRETARMSLTISMARTNNMIVDS